MKEIWKDIKDYEGLYQVSNLGRVRSVDRYVKSKGNSKRLVKGKILKLYINNCGYCFVLLKGKCLLVHRLVAETFKPNPHNYPTVDHINRIKTDNRVENLRWAPWELQAKNRIPSQKNRPVLQYTLDGQFVAEYSSINEAARQTGVNQTSISYCCRKSAGGYNWKYKEYS